MDLVPDDLPDGAYWAMAHEMAGLDYGDGFDELLPSTKGMNGPQEASYRKPSAVPAKKIKAAINKAGYELHQHDAYHFTVRKEGKVCADWWPHKNKWRIGGKMASGDAQAFIRVLTPIPG